MKRALKILFFFHYVVCFPQAAENLIPTNTTTHQAIASGNWSNAAIWSTNSIPDQGAIVHIPNGITVNYSLETAAHIFGIRVDGTLRVEQTDNTKTTKIKFDTFYGSPSSLVQFIANTTSDGNIEITIEPFDIENHKTTVTSGDTAWNTSATNHYSDGLDVNQIEREITLGRRYKTHDLAVAAYNGQSPFDNNNTTTSSTIYNDGIGVTGRYEWDPMQMSIGLIIKGQLEIIGKEKTTYVQLAQDALRQQEKVVLSSEPTNWLSGDEILITKSGKIDATQNATEVTILDTYDTPTTLSMVSNLTKNHEGTPDPDFTLHCYAGNLTRNIVFKSGLTSNIHHRGHLMVMETNTNVQIKNAQFKDMGRTDKSRWVDDQLFNEWTETNIFKSFSSPLGQNVANSYLPNAEDITNSRGRYSIHLHKNGSRLGDNLIQVTGNVVWGNPGWGITQHDAYANISDNVVYDVLGAGIVSESGSETGFWNNNLVAKITHRNNGDTDSYNGALFYNDYLFEGIGLGMKGRAVVCNDNVIADVQHGILVMNMNPNSGSVDKVDPLQLATVRPNFQIDQFPLSTNGYSKEGDDVMPVEVALIMNNTTVIGSYRGFKSIERDMGVNHESRSVFDGFILWGISQGITNTYQANYTFIDTFISGRTTSSSSLGLYMWKHSFNHIYKNIKFKDLGYAVVPSKLVGSSSGQYKTRNNGFTPWIFIDAEVDNIGSFYQVVAENSSQNSIYTEHSDNPIFFTSSDVNVNRDITFTLLDEASTGLPYYEIPGDLQFNFGYVDYNETDPDKQFSFAIDGVVTDQLGAYKFGIEQPAAQGTLRRGYPERLYQFASEAKFIEYLTANGVYKNPIDNSLYFIINELVPDRLTSEYKSFPLRIKIINAPTTGIFSNPEIESDFGCVLENKLISRLATVSQSSTQTGESYSFDGQNLAIDPNASKAIDGNTNARDNAQYLQQFDTTGVPVGTYSLTEVENQPWYDLDFGNTAEITYIDIWNTVTLNGEDIAPTNDNLTDFYIMLDDEPFTGKSLSQALADANWSHHQTTPVGRKLSLDTEVVGNSGRYMRIQKSENSTQLKLAEVEVLGKISEEIGASAAFVWQGNTDTNWDTPSNWNTNSVPTASDNVFVGNVTNKPIATGNVSINNITIAASTSLKVQGNLTINGIMNINSDEDGFGSLIVEGSSSGDITYNRYATYNEQNTLGWHLMGSPVENGTIEYSILRGCLANGSSDRKGLALYDNNQSHPSFGSWVYQTSSSTGSLNSGQGFSIKRSSVGTIPFTGTLKTDDVTYAIQVGSENYWNLISNPYAASINANQNSNSFLSENLNQLNTTTGAVYIWDSKAQNGMGEYKIINYASDQTTIAPGQGFFVASKPGGGSISITENMQTLSSESPFARNTTPKITLNISNGDITKSSDIKFIDTTTKGLDYGYDGKLFDGINSNLSIFTQLVEENEGVKFMLQALPKTVLKDVTIPIGIDASLNTALSLQIEAKNFPEELNIYLEDRLHKKILHLTDNIVTYNFSLSSNEEKLGRFYVHTQKKQAMLNNSLDYISIYKNSTGLTVLGYEEKEIHLELYDLLGKKVFDSSFYLNGTKDIVIGKIPKGVYIIRLNNSEQVISKKIVF